MSKKHLITASAEDPRNLLLLLSQRLGWSAAQAAKAVREGAVWVDGRRVTPAVHSVVTGARLTVFADHDPAPVAVPQVRVVYEDRELLVVCKPAGLLCQPGRRGGPSLLTVLPGPLWLPHRLDGDTSGLTMLAKSAEACARLGQALRDGQIERHYLARVTGVPPERGRIELRIGKRAGPASPSGSHSSSPRMITYPAQSQLGVSAESQFERRDTLTGPTGSQSLLLVRLATGRTHQVRVHLAALGHPIVGDKLYGGSPFARLGLHAATLVLVHPRTGQRLLLESELPENFWPRPLPIATELVAP